MESYSVFAQRATDDLSSLKVQFLASLNHEIRTPLSGIMGMTDLLLETPLTADQREYVDAAKDCASQLFGLLSTVLEYNALMSGSVKIDRAEFRLSGFLDSLQQEFAPQAAQRGLQLKADVPAAIPDLISGDEYRLRQVCSILLGNALRYTPSGSVTLRVSRPAGDGGVCFEVCDTGVGISAELLEKIFRPFGVAEAGHRKANSGIGLGVALAQGLIRRMEGELTVNSVLGQGTEFRFTIPCAFDVQPVAQAARQPVAANHRVLVVEDDRIAQRIILAILGKAQIDCDSVPDGPSAIAKVAENQYGLVLMDLQMPGMDGFEAARQILSQDPAQRTPVVALTANTDDETRQRCWEAGMSAFLSKPVQPSELLGTLQRFLR